MKLGIPANASLSKKCKKVHAYFQTFSRKKKKSTKTISVVDATIICAKKHVEFSVLRAQH